MEVLLGADPEVFVQKNGVPISAYGMIPGTKKAPHKVDFGAVQIDGMAAEFNIDPAKTEQEFVHNISSVFKTLESMIPKNCQLHVVPSVKFDEQHFAEQPEAAKELGCDPDYNAYTQKANPRPDNKTTLRTAAGHVHIGWTKDQDISAVDHFKMCCVLAKQLDWYLGIPSVALDTDVMRRTMYGKAGCFRPKSYGMEYRTLSNFWLKSPELMKWVFNTTQLAVKELMEDREISKVNYVSADYWINPSRKSTLSDIQRGYPAIWTKINTFGHLLGKC